MRSFDHWARTCELARPEKVRYGLFLGYLLYRFYNADHQLLYVGITTQPEGRWALHRRKSAWWPSVASVAVSQLPNKETARAAERDAIQTENPMYNIADRPPLVLQPQISAGNPADAAADRGGTQPRYVVAHPRETASDSPPRWPTQPA